MASKAQLIEELKKYPDVVFNENATNAVLAGILNAAKGNDTKQKEPLKQHEVERLERIIRKATRCDGGWTKGISTLDRNAAKAAMAKLGRKKPEWDRTINLGMVNESTAIRPKTGHNSID